MLRHLIIGQGEVGESLYEVLNTTHDVYIRDIQPIETPPIDMMHICIPGNLPDFVEIVRAYQAEHSPKYTVIHSSVPVGTSRKLGAVHSPIHGRHPNLVGGIRTFVKYVGGADAEAVKVVAFELLAAGIPIRIVANAETSEHSKLACTRSLGLSVVEIKEIERECAEYGSNFEQVYGWRSHYNSGYQQLGMAQFTRPVLKLMPGPVGGHCVITNCKITPDRPIEKFILERDAQYAKEKL